MSDASSQAALVPVGRDLVAVLKRAGVDNDIAELVGVSESIAMKMCKRKLVYLQLPPVLAPLASASWYQHALCYGRGVYYTNLFDLDEQDNLVRAPYPYEREEIREFILVFLSLDDPQVAISVPLSWRVGVVVGWLSGLAISQRDDAQAAMVMLATLVAPLLGNVPSGSVPNISDSSHAVQSLLSSKSKKTSRRSKAGRK